MKVLELIKKKLIVRAEINTSAGTIKLNLDCRRAPLTVHRFIELATTDFYVDTVFHRTVKDFIIQGGGHDINQPEKEKNAAEQLKGIQNESLNGLTNIPGTIGLARNNIPNSGKCQFYINLSQNWRGNASAEEPGYTVFGYVTEGMQVVEKISLSKTRENNRELPIPEELVVIKSVSIEESFVNSEEFKMAQIIDTETKQEHDLHRSVYENFLSKNEGIDHAASIGASFGSSSSQKAPEALMKNKQITNEKIKEQKKLEESLLNKNQNENKDANTTANEMLKRFTEGNSIIDNKKEKQSEDSNNSEKVVEFETL